MQEIERKYLLNKSIKRFLDTVSHDCKHLIQFYIKSTPRKSVRFRKAGKHYFKTMKTGVGGIREEHETEVSEKLFTKNLKKHIGDVIEKKRCMFTLDDHEYSVDIYEKPFDDFYILEIEFDSESSYKLFQLPHVLEPYIRKEVTDNESYKNSNLALFGLPLAPNDGRRSDVSIQMILEVLRLKIIAYREKVLYAGDDEDLHQLRIHLRKSIALLGAFRFLFDDKKVLQQMDALKGMISITNKKRDLDVLQKQLVAFGHDLKTTQFKDAFLVLQEDISRDLECEHQKILHYLQSDSCIQILQEYQAFIKDISPTHGSIYGSFSIASVSKFVMEKRFKKIRKMIQSLKLHHKEHETLHKLRIGFKRLRYMLEPFGYLYDEKTLKKLLKEIKKVQTILGTFHDKYQQRLIFTDLLKQQNNPAIKFFIENSILPRLRNYQKKEITEIAKSLNDFLEHNTLFSS